MAERPDLDYWVPWLAKDLPGARVARVEVDKPVVLRVVVRGAFDELVTGRVIESVGRRGNFVLFGLGALADRPPIDVAVSCMLAGRFRIVPPAEGKAKPKLPGDRAVSFHLEDGRILVYRDDVQMGKVYVLERGAYDSVPGLAKIGIDCLDPKRFTLKAFLALAKTRRDQAKVFLMDKSALDFFGNAYADEALFEARIHPKAFVRSLDEAALTALHAAIVKTLGDARRIIHERKPPLDEKLRDFLSVRLHAGEPCPRCQTRIRKAGVHGHDAFFCPSCQPDARGSTIVDWRKLGGGPPGGEGAT
ncbi:MAG: DNA-formamidopyrimidine glycosylase family protein [Polyangiaceae bacterium]